MRTHPKSGVPDTGENYNRSRTGQAPLPAIFEHDFRGGLLQVGRNLFIEPAGIVIPHRTLPENGGVVDAGLQIAAIEVGVDRIRRFIGFPLGEQVESTACQQAGDDEEQQNTVEFSRFHDQHLWKNPQRCRVVRQAPDNPTYSEDDAITWEHGFFLPLIPHSG